MKDKATVRVHACNFISSNCITPVTGLTASLCGKKDFNCQSPIETGLHDVDGDFTFQVPTGGASGTGFDGYLLVDTPTELCTNRDAFGGADTCVSLPACDPAMPDESCALPTVIPALLFFNPPVIADLARPLVLPLIPYTAGISLVTGAGASTSALSSGIVFATGLDCAGSPAAGLHFDVLPAPPGLSAVYQTNGVISASASETDASGLGGLLGVPAGFVRVSAYVQAAGARREVASIGAQIRPLTVTYVSLIPPSP